ncbi:MAG: 50S ribosomal protein L32 [Deltaproteobacteria bacterium]|nr:50S ribosomal protein L32 [Deltaproteobacteria bacterium]
MAVPKRRRTSSRRDMRRAHFDKVEAPNLVPCPNCSAPIVPHRVCASCGHYKGRNVRGAKAPAGTEPGSSAG